MPKPGLTDTVPAMLTPGEIVVNREAVDLVGADKLNAANKKGLGIRKTNAVQGYADGGEVSAFDTYLENYNRPGFVGASPEGLDVKEGVSSPAPEYKGQYAYGGGPETIPLEDAKKMQGFNYTASEMSKPNGELPYGSSRGGISSPRPAEPVPPQNFGEKPVNRGIRAGGSTKPATGSGISGVTPAANPNMMTQAPTATENTSAAKPKGINNALRGVFTPIALNFDTPNRQYTPEPTPVQGFADGGTVKNIAEIPEPLAAETLKPAGGAPAAEISPVAEQMAAAKQTAAVAPEAAKMGSAASYAPPKVDPYTGEAVRPTAGEGVGTKAAGLGRGIARGAAKILGAASVPAQVIASDIANKQALEQDIAEGKPSIGTGIRGLTYIASRAPSILARAITGQKPPVAEYSLPQPEEIVPEAAAPVVAKAPAPLVGAEKAPEEATPAAAPALVPEAEAPLVPAPTVQRVSKAKTEPSAPAVKKEREGPTPEEAAIARLEDIALNQGPTGDMSPTEFGAARRRQAMAKDLLAHRLARQQGKESTAVEREKIEQQQKNLEASAAAAAAKEEYQRAKDEEEQGLKKKTLEERTGTTTVLDASGMPVQISGTKEERAAAKAELERAAIAEKSKAFDEANKIRPWTNVSEHEAKKAKAVYGKNIPPAAFELLQKNPEAISDFEKKYGYRPEGYNG